MPRKSTRPPKTHKRIVISLPVELADWLLVYCEKYSVDLNNVVATALNAYRRQTEKKP